MSEQVHIPGQWSTQWARAEERYWQAYCRSAGICAVCGQRAEKHEPGCRNEPQDDDEQEDSDE
jgi:hypothetical protein